MSERDLEPLPDDVALLLDAERARPSVGKAPRDRVAARLSAALGPALLGVAGATASGTAATAAAAATATGAAAGGATVASAIGAAAGAGALAAGGAATTGAAGAGAVLPAVGGAGFLGGLLAKPFVVGIAVAVIGAGAAGVYTARTSDEPSHATSMSTSAPASTEAEPPRAAAIPAEPARDVAPPDAPATAATAPSAPPVAAPTATAAAAASSAGKPGRDSDLAAERALLEEARAAVVRGQGASALQAIDRHAAQFPRGRLSEEREALRVQALVAAGRRGEARERAERFRDAYPRSLALPALEQAVGPL